MFLNQHRRRSIRLREYNYGQAGWYYVTVCAYGRQPLFGRIENGRVVLNELGWVVREEWLNTPRLRPNVALDYFIIMPDHLHGIIVIDNCRGDAMHRPGQSFGQSSGDHDRATQRVAPTLQSNTIGSIVGQFKSVVTKRINQLRQAPTNPVWQRNYYEHIIRNEKSLAEIRQYIISNPFNPVDK